MEFREIDLDQHFDLCVAFRADASVCSFGSADPFYRRAGDGCRDYRAQLSEQMKALPGSCVHGWLDGRIVGQIEMRRDPADPTRGHVRLFYLAPEVRGQGLATRLEEYTEDLLSRAGITLAWLRVSPSNERALRHYLKHGWTDTGPDRDTTHRMEKRVLLAERLPSSMTVPLITYRHLQAGDDLDAITRLLHEAYAPLAAAGMRYVASHQDVATTRRRMSHGETFVAVCDDAVVGVVTLAENHATHGSPFYDRPDVASFGQFAVLPALQHQGIGSRLIKIVEQRAREKGVAELALDTSEHAEALIAMYTKRG